MSQGPQQRHCGEETLSLSPSRAAMDVEFHAVDVYGVNPLWPRKQRYRKTTDVPGKTSMSHIAVCNLAIRLG